MNITNLLRKNIGTIIACLGFVLLCIITLGDLGELASEQYWINVWQNMTAIGFVSLGLTFIQTSIKQGLAEQALQRGLNTERTLQKYEEHREIIKDLNSKMIYLPYFLQIYNKRHTKLQKREYLINNNYKSEDALLTSGNRKAIKFYKNIVVHITAPSIKWSTVEVVYNKKGQILTLDEHRKRRLFSAIVMSGVSMVGVTFLTGGLFFSPSQEPLWQKFVKLFTYCVAIAVGSIFTVIKEYEKGAFGVPNELDEINQIWREFQVWEIPEWVAQEVYHLNQEGTSKDEEVNYEPKREGSTDGGADISKEQTESENLCNTESDSVVSVSCTDDNLCMSDAEE